MIKKLVIIPSDSISSYINAGIDWLEEYYNPNLMFDKIFILSPFDKEKINITKNIEVIPIKNNIDYLKKIKKIKPNIIRAYGGKISADIACYNKIPNVPVIVSLHDSRYSWISKSIKNADLILCMSNIIKNKVIKKISTKNKIIILPNRVNTQIFKKNMKDIKKYGKYILCIGRRSKEKNIETIIKSLKYIQKDINLLQIGKGSKDKYQKIAKKINVNERCIWLNNISNKELPRYYSNSICLCNPSLNEGFGIIFIEAAACEAKIVTSNISPMNEYLTNKKNALLINNYKSPKEIAKQINDILNNKYKNIGKNARKISLKFDKKTISNKEEKIYQDILRKNITPIIKNKKVYNLLQIKYYKLKYFTYFKSISMFKKIKLILKNG